MAFATANTRAGTMGDLKIFAGDWTGSEGDAAGTITLSGARVYSTSFTMEESQSREDRPVPTSASVTSGLVTVTIYNHVTVTAGRFIIWYA